MTVSVELLPTYKTTDSTQLQTQIGDKNCYTAEECMHAWHFAVKCLNNNVWM